MHSSFSLMIQRAVGGENDSVFNEVADSSQVTVIMVGTLLLLWIGFFLLFFLYRSQRPKNFPPGPRPIPLFGNLLQLTLDNPIEDLKKLSAQYGKVFSLYLGGRPAVVLNGLQAMKEAMVTKSVDFAGRPQGLMVSHITEGKGVILADYGPSWREHRRFALMTLRNFGLGKKSMEERILDEISYVITCLDRSVGQSMSPQTLFHKAASNIICSIIFGIRYDHDDKYLQDIIRMFTGNAKIFNGPWAMIYDALPLVRSLPLPFQKAFQNTAVLKKMAADMIAQHKSTRDPGEPRDLIDCYLDEIEKRGDNGSPFCEDQLIIYILDIYIAGTDTTSNTMLFALLYLMTYPEVQARCQQEIDTVLGDKTIVSYEDRHEMPYIQATIHEAQRLSSMVPFSVFHSTTKDTQLMGYNIPKGTLIIQNLSTVLHEEGQWKFPHDFNPTNFLNEQGEFVKPEAFMPFSVGPRVCLGESLARMELFLFLVTLLRRYQFVWPEDAGVPDLSPVWGVTLSPKPYKLGVRLRGDKTG
ncbi:cytochrome P450 2F2-like [Paramormyrops kingsleyae]|uniref:cytochrome P450 2F2-like n=1 Tax=Paramormyrops kingsleyae TaxID=1676925 RepID=UPI000CD61410|nr:cytochrome P450 2F2-like [Paramormyrops kingsleyae]XP_023682987.1 cytochrome P450 2F2-like [Paramormyrops kingsleyae]XP_023682988.1 cytochrome P450 2F2-like [Paramormyrops kingsleyae]XP_023682989.1 cytochrome P450 2F2-like [Paramormyrops kingsleyae]XP_023682990.1 cytochrome P450 2F2-like [Paramormyrops kingsleyae]XP_023682991.1 cytochrome P450 2F2-like [Paramormyrops kingsleyae]